KREATGIKSAPLTKRSKKVKESSGEDSSSATENDSKYNAWSNIKSPVLDNVVMAAIIKDHRNFNDFNREAHSLHPTICNALRLWPKQAKNKNYLMLLLKHFY
ncbi:unnamed protein product, partial [Didymodactylos carnosus]